MDKVIVVVAGVIIRDNRILLTQRDPKRSDFGWKWETPGGKVKIDAQGEHEEGMHAALRRELREELGVEAVIGAGLKFVRVEPPVVRVTCALTFYLADIGDQMPRPLEAIGLGWFTREEMLTLDLAPANVIARNTLACLLP